ncbi:MAG: T9SS type A sorting domain-containing protein [Bacteroidetes bacterium]|nr:T9SS type A sorting domain-containing protein [Bacteroidota bacterium]MDA1121506.1 T9SS type A sorting domain-containing protein [Bacteroidota bacterium]
MSSHYHFWDSPNHQGWLGKIITITVFVVCNNYASAQFQIVAGANTIDFEGYGGGGFTQTPAAGELDSDQWAVDEGDDQTYDLDFGGSVTTGALAGGGPIATPGTPSGGLFSADLGSSDEGFGVIIDNSFFSNTAPGGAVLLKVQNKTGGVITDFNVAFSTLYYNISNKNINVQFFYSTVQNSGYTSTGYSVTSGTTNAWTALTAGNENITGLSIAEDGYFYFKWTFVPSNSGPADAIALNDIVITPTVVNPSTTTTVVAGATSEPASFSSLINTVGAASVNFDFLVTDDNGSGGDALETKINTITIRQGTGNDIGDWSQAIVDAELDDGAGPTFAVTSITATTLVFPGMPNSVAGDMGFIADNGAKTYSLKIALKNPTEGTVPNTLDGSNFVLLVNNSSFTLEALSSRLAASQSVNSGSTNNAVAVVATELQFSNIPNSVGVGLGFSLTLSATDTNGNVDLDNSASVTLSEDDAGVLSSVTGLSQTLSSGSFSWTDLIYDAVGIFQISGTDGGALTDVITGDILAAQAFRSANAGGGTWSTAGDWELFNVGTSMWEVSGVSPTNAVGPITIRNGFNMTITAGVTVNQVAIESGATLRHTGGTLTISDLSGESDVVIDGTFDFENGAPTINAGATIEVNSGGIIEVSANSGTTDNVLAGSTSSGDVIWNDGAIFNWNVTTDFAEDTYFPDAAAGVIPIFRISGAIGGTNNSMILNGLLEANTAVTWGQNEDRTFRNGVIGTGDVAFTNGDIFITGVTAVLGGTGALGLDGTTVTIGSGTTLTMISDKVVNNGTLAIASGSVLNFQGFVLSGTAGLTLSNGSTTETTNTLGLTTSIGVSGTETYGTIANFIFDGSAAQNTNFPTAITQLNNITINNSAGVTLDQAIAIDGTLTLTNGIFSTSSGNLPTLSATGTTSGGSSSTFVDGPLGQNNFSVSTTFPVGDGADYRPVILNPDNESDMIVEHFTGAPLSGTLAGGLMSISPFRYWTITRSSGTGNVTITITFDPGEENIVDLNNLRIARRDVTGPTWENEGQTANTSTTVTGSASTFSDYTLGSTDTALPVELIAFTGLITERGEAILNWSTAQEINNDYFEIQRSRDGYEFEVIGSVTGAGSTDRRVDYSFIDTHPYFGLSYYRLKQVDFDGQFEYSNVIWTNNTSLREGIEVSVFPNPAESSNVNLRISTGDENSPIVVRIIDLGGNLLFHGKYLFNAFEQEYAILLPPGFSPGLYIVSVEQGYNSANLRLLIR